MVQGRFSSLIVSAISLIIALSALFLRNVVYYDLQPSEYSKGIPTTVPANTPITLAYHERPPYYVTTGDKSLGGAVGKIAFAVMQDSGLEFTVKKIPPKRQLNNVKNNSIRICCVGWFINPERQLFARFTDPIYQGKPLSILTRNDVGSIHNDLTLRQLMQDDALRMLVKNSYSYGQQVDTLIRNSNQPLASTVGDSRQMMDMIAAGKADYFFLAPEEAATLLAGHKHPEQFKVVILADMPPAEKRYLMCSKLVKKEEITRINEAIKRIAEQYRNGDAQ